MIGSLSAVLDEYRRIANKVRTTDEITAAELDVATEILTRAFSPGAAPAETPPSNAAAFGNPAPSGTVPPASPKTPAAKPIKTHHP